MNIQSTVVLTVDSAHARLFRVDGTSPGGFSNLVEVLSLAHLEARIPESQRHSNLNPGSAIGGGGYQTFDDRHEEHEYEERRRFAKRIALALADAVPTPCHAVVGVRHSMHALLNDALELHCMKLLTSWYPRDCAPLSPHDLSKVLTERGLLPEQRFIRGTWGNAPPRNRTALSPDLALAKQ